MVQDQTNLVDLKKVLNILDGPFSCVMADLRPTPSWQLAPDPAPDFNTYICQVAATTAAINGICTVGAHHTPSAALGITTHSLTRLEFI